MYSEIIDADWFDPTNQEAKAKREDVNKKVVLDMIAFLNEHNNGIAIMDSTNPTHARREALHKTVWIHFVLQYFLLLNYELTVFYCNVPSTSFQIQQQTGAKVMFIEVINEDVKFLENQYQDAAALNPDYAGQNAAASVSQTKSKDFCIVCILSRVTFVNTSGCSLPQED